MGNVLSKAFDDCGDIEEESIPAVVANKTEEIEDKACLRFCMVASDNSSLCKDFGGNHTKIFSREPFKDVFIAERLVEILSFDEDSGQLVSLEKVRLFLFEVVL